MVNRKGNLKINYSCQCELILDTGSTFIFELKPEIIMIE